MKEKIIGLAILIPHAYPWDKENLEMTIDELDSLLKDLNLGTEVDRRTAAYSLDIACYLNSVNSNCYIDLMESIKEAFKSKAYLNESLIEKQLNRKRLANDEEIKTFKSFLNNTLTVEEIKSNTQNIQMWFVELINYCKLAAGSEISADEIRGNIIDLLQKYYPEINSKPLFIDKLRKTRGINRDYNFKLIHNTVKEYRVALESLMSKYLEANKQDYNFEDELFDIINDFSDYEEEVEEVKVEEKTAEVKESKKELPPKEEAVVTSNVVNIQEDDLVAKHLKALAESLGYKVIDNSPLIDEDSEIGMLKELASYKKGAILSELYNAYIDIENVSKENLEAIINNFFTSLKLQGFEAEELHLVGDKVQLDTKDLLVEFVLTQPVAEKGIIEGEVKYLPWLYKGKKVTPMVVKPIIK